MSWLNYICNIAPSNPSAVVQATTVSPEMFTLTVTSMDAIDISLSVPPDHGLAQKIIETIVLPVASALANILEGKVQELVVGKTFDQKFDPPIGFTIDVAGIAVTIRATSLSAAGYQGFIAFTGTVVVS